MGYGGSRTYVRQCVSRNVYLVNGMESERGSPSLARALVSYPGSISTRWMFVSACCVLVVPRADRLSQQCGSSEKERESVVIGRVPRVKMYRRHKHVRFIVDRINRNSLFDRRIAHTRGRRQTRYVRSLRRLRYTLLFLFFTMLSVKCNYYLRTLAKLCFGSFALVLASLPSRAPRFARARAWRDRARGSYAVV